MQSPIAFTRLGFMQSKIFQLVKSLSNTLVFLRRLASLRLKRVYSDTRGFQRRALLETERKDDLNRLDNMDNQLILFQLIEFITINQEQLMMNTLTGGCNMPREMLRWLDSLDLSFTVRNPRVDLANGFIVAQIICRYFPKEVNIYSFYNNQAKEKRINNWEQIQKVLAKKGFHLSKEQFESLSNLGPNAALDLIYRLYEYLTKKKIKNDNRTIELADEVPLYMKPTASYLAKDRELERIVDKNQKESKTKKAIQSHLTSIKNKKYSTGLIEWLIAKRKAEINEEIRRQEELLNKKTRTIGIEPRGEIKQIQLKCFNQSGGRGGGSKTKNVVDFILDSFFIYMKKDFIIRDLRRLGLELKQKDEHVNAFLEIFKRCNEQEDDRRKVSSTTLEYLIKQLNEPAEISLVFENIHDNFSDFKKYFSLFVPALKAYDENETIYKLITQLIFKISAQLIEQDPDITQMMFSQLILQDYLSISKEKPDKTRSICQIILSFSRPTPLNQYQMLIKVREHLTQPHEYIHYLSYFISIILVITEQIEENLWNQSYDYAISGIQSASSITRTNSVKIISELVMFSDEIFFSNLEVLAGLVNDEWWEVRALALIVYSRLIISRKKGFDNTVEKSNEAREGNEKSKKQINYEAMFKQITQNILKIFHIGADEKILRVGLIELAELLNYEKSLCPRYLEVLLSIDQSIILNVLNTNQNKIGTVSDQKNTFQYRLTGAAAEWDPTGVMQALHAGLHESKTYVLESKHIHIILACLKRNSESENKAIWLKIFNDFKPILFSSTKSVENSKSASEIIHSFFTIPEIHKQIMANSKQDFRVLLSQVYSTKQQTVTTSILNLLKSFSIQDNQYLEYVYQILKQFSEIEREKYLSSNLVEFMNDLARKRREGMYSI